MKKYCGISGVELSDTRTFLYESDVVSKLLNRGLTKPLVQVTVNYFGEINEVIIMEDAINLYKMDHSFHSEVNQQVINGLNK